MKKTEKFYTCEEVAARYGVEIPTVWGWLRNGKLGGFKAGKFYKVRESDLKKFEQAVGK